MRVQFFVPGRPQTSGSKTSVPIRTGDGHVVGNRVIEAGTKQSRAAKVTWRGDLRDAAEKAVPDDWPMDAAMELVLLFVRKRPSGHLRSGRYEGMVKDRVLHLLPTERPDALKLARSVEDALTGIVWLDDSQVTDGHQCKRFGDQVGMDPRAQGVQVTVRALIPADGHGIVAPVPDQEELSV
jgi:Holliday junction resolvase RusA-like endonuclease